MDQLTNSTIYIVDDDEDFRNSMSWLLESVNCRVECFSSARSFLERYDGGLGCMLLDVRMPEINGLALQQIMIERNIKMPIIVISGHGDIQMAVSAMKQGAIDFIEKPFDGDVLIRLVKKALSLAEDNYELRTEETRIRELYANLSQREVEVMDLVVQGNANREIADQLNISPKTVEVHRSRVMAKMQASNIADLIRLHNNLAPK
ncbi:MULTISPECIES: response regulator transcription factor [unclassified Marinobacterium]|jgi:RNA polymerase sigma factor (sigma-70 family)|uniref:response regulator transcription factor n=1 Tax=unclassified Marinobacterium TaxID=2644139 RepID=UPI0015697441|nr:MULTISPECIES: response regulator [unclassified Marinobacterium]NRP10643.1 Response regulator protein TmoT [Marinobacterium sp. xm-g-48]NRP36866.1 Response regulator protein TmoT [Marinobacterium sp. xm-d-579]NRP46763.1 Response regulator protein TmoT [Marinobacterium sp. xm-d-543]NRP83653.1 Response regulator protein TmoT [Marinobacterium sp. xm-d-509]NRQ01991.1 Response regulator protein TmoT [Marinobacterium sp. xm-d-530]